MERFELINILSVKHNKDDLILDIRGVLPINDHDLILSAVDFHCSDMLEHLKQVYILYFFLFFIAFYYFWKVSQKQYNKIL